MFKASVTIALLGLVGLQALVRCDHYDVHGAHISGAHMHGVHMPGYVSYPHAHHNNGHRLTRQRLNHKLKHLAHDPKVQRGIHALKPAVGYASAVAQPVINNALRKANEWSSRRDYAHHGSHYMHPHASAYHIGHYPGHVASSHHHYPVSIHSGHTGAHY